MFSTPQSPDWLWGPPSLLSDGYRGSSPPGREAAGGVKLITHLHLMPRSRLVKLYLHFSIRIHGVVLNQFSNFTFLPCSQASVARTCIEPDINYAFLISPMSDTCSDGYYLEQKRVTKKKYFLAGTCCFLWSSCRCPNVDSWKRRCALSQVGKTGSIQGKTCYGLLNAADSSTDHIA
jgi:hypothetical protein